MSNNSTTSSEDFYKCKAKGIIESIKTPIWINLNCLNLRIKLNEWSSTYVFYAVWNNPTCTTKLEYNLSWENFPKIWDEFYIIWTHRKIDILQTWEKAYNENINLPNCPANYEWDEEARDIYDNMNKCQISWKIYDITKDLFEPCPYYNLNMIIQSQGKLYTVFGKETVQDPLLGCLGISTDFPIYKNRWESYYPKVWDSFSAILDINSNYSILRYGEEFLNNDIPLCTGNFLSNVIEEPKETPIQKPKKEDSPEIKESPPPSKITPPIIIDKKEAQELSNTWTGNLENSWSIQELTIENNSWNLNQSEMENIENIEEINIISHTESINKVDLPSQKIDSSFYYIWWIIIFLLIIFWVWIFKIYKKN